ncbi:class I SAM-dependent methyltransferase [Oceanicola sp. S124]|uniref:class I SAM-dependent methyltransferase n=1 Tax=Oceanicola sp. S124 TaxID=1042378 RepID=UPI0002558529|nr:class I SAM-dependent methyltransferase [Oceanicola sp. S124]
MGQVTSGKRIYVGLARGLGRLLRMFGLLALLERLAPHARLAHWLRSLFAVHDLEGLVALDVPWWTYGAIDRVDAFLRGHAAARVFEYGSGASTIWLARRAASVTSIEHHAGWGYKVQGLIDRLPDLCPVRLRTVLPDADRIDDPLYVSGKKPEEGQSFRAYAGAIEREVGLFDLIVIDGRARAACLAHAVTRLAPGGMIVFDNSHRARYRQAIVASGLKAEVLRGLTPSLPYPDETTLLGAPGPRA